MTEKNENNPETGCWIIGAIVLAVTIFLIIFQTPRTTTEYVYPTNEPAPVYNTAIPQPTPNISQYIEPNSNKSWAETVKEMCKD